MIRRKPTRIETATDDAEVFLANYEAHRSQFQSQGKDVKQESDECMDTTDSASKHGGSKSKSEMVKQRVGFTPAVSTTEGDNLSSADMVQVAIASGSGKLPFDGKKPQTTPFTYYVAFMAVIGGFLFGYDTGVVSSAMLFVPEAMKLDYVWTELIVSVTVGACAVFSLVAGAFNDWIGRRKTILIASFLFTVGAVLLAAAQEKIMLLLGRIVIGAAVGLASMTVPIYIAEVCPAHLRGTMVTGFQLMITLGLFIASILGGAFSYIDPLRVGWRLMFCVAGIPSLLQFIGFLFLPESPRWLANRNLDKEAEEVLQKVYKEQEYIDFEMNEIRESRQNLKVEMEALGGGWVLLHMLKTPHVRKALLLGCSLQAFQQLAGVNTLMYYTASIIKMSGIRDPSQAIWMSCLITGVNFICTFIPITLVERLGRRILWLGSLIAVIASTLLLAIAFLLINKSAPNQVSPYPIPNATKNVMNDFNFCKQLSNCDDCVTMEKCGFCFPKNHSSTNSNYGWCLPAALGNNSVSEIGPCHYSERINLRSGHLIWAWNFCPSKYSWMPIFGMVCYLCSFAGGAAPMPWVINSEIYPYWARSTGIALATFFNWAMNLVISQTFLTLTEAVTKYGAFFLYTGITSFAFVLFFFVLPETKGYRIEQVEELFGKKTDSKQIRVGEKESKF